MKSDEKNGFGGWETGCLTINLMIYRIFTKIPAMFARMGGAAAFLSSVISGIVGLFLILLLLKLFERHKSGNLLDVAEKSFGKVGGFLAMLFLLGYIAVCAIYNLQEFSELIKLIAFPTSPLWFVKIFLIVASGIGAFCGIRAIFKTHATFIPILVALTLLVVVSAMRYGNVENLFPVLGNGAENILKGGLSGAFIYSDIILILMLNPFGEDRKKLKDVAWRSSVVGIIINCIVVFALNFTIPYPSSAEANFPIYSLLKEVWYGRFFQRVDAIYMLFLAISAMLQISVLVFLAGKLLKQTAKTETMRIYILPICLTLFMLSLISEAKGYFTLDWLYLSGAIAVAVTFATAVSGRRRKNEKMED